MTTATTTTGLNLRTGPGTGNSVLLVIPADTQVTITGPERNGWYPVTYGKTPGWASSKYLLLDPKESAESRARRSLLSYLHIPYIWGGQSRDGLDCSGLVGVWWVEIGFRSKGFDTTADRLFDGYRTGQLPGERLGSGRFGALAFYGSGTTAGHVTICYDDVACIGANGGAKSVTTAAEARRRGACVRMDRIAYRDDLLGIWMPAYGWT